MFGINLRYAWRRVLRQPSLTATIVLVLGLGLGMNILMFSVMDKVVLRPVPFPGLDRLVSLWSTQIQHGVPRAGVSAPDFLDWSADTRTFQAITAVERGVVGVGLPGQSPQPLQSAKVTTGFFSVFQPRFLLGGAPSAADPIDEGKIGVLSQRAWHQLFDGHPQALGRTLLVDGRLVTIVGILRGEEDFPRGTEIWLPVRLQEDPTQRGKRSWLVFGRLAAGRTVEQAQAEMAVIAERLAREYPATNGKTSVEVSRLRDDLVEQLRPTLTLISVALLLSLIIACVNLGNLLHVRVADHERDVWVSVALGARKSQVAVQVTWEILLLSLAGAVLSLMVFFLGRSLLLASAVASTIRAESLVFDARVWLSTLMLLLVVAFIVGLAPVVSFLALGSRNQAADGPRLSSRGSDRRTLRVQRGMVVVQIVVSLPLLVGSVILLQDLRRIAEVDLGFRAEGVYVGRLIASIGAVSPHQRAQSFFEVLGQVGGIEGVERVGLVSDLPFSGSRTSGDFVLLDRSTDVTNEAPSSDLRVVAGEYFQAMGVPLLDGRFFRSDDDHFAPGVAIINAEMARRFWKEGDPIGHRVLAGTPEERALYGGPIERVIVGVVGNIIHEGLTSNAQPELYLPASQNPVANLTLVVRFRAGSGKASQAALLHTFMTRLRNTSISGLVPMGQIVSRSLGHPELQAAVVVLLGFVSVVLVGISFYTIVSCYLSRQRRKLGVRIALGAGLSEVSKTVARQLVPIWIIGLAFGLLLSRAVLGIVASRLHVGDTEPVFAFSVAGGLVAALTLVSASLPTRRILREEPIELLRGE